MRSRGCFLLLALMLTLSSSLVRATEAEALVGIEIKDAFLREIIPGQSTAAVYLTIVNHRDTLISLAKVETDIAGMSMIHATAKSSAGVKMLHIESLEIQPGREVEFKPGGLHVMLMNLKQRPQVGESVNLTLYFEGVDPIHKKIPVRQL